MLRFVASFFILAAVSVAAENTNLVEQIDGNTFRIGQVRLKKKERRLAIPASVNMVEGPIEYVLVSTLGKLHESIFKTTADPIHIHTAASLLLKGPIHSNSPPKVTIAVEKLDGKAIDVESTIDNTTATNRLKRTSWTYLGSRMVEGTFIAQRDGSVISIIPDPDALCQSGRVTADDDENWRPQKSALPPVGTPVKILLTFE